MPSAELKPSSAAPQLRLLADASLRYENLLRLVSRSVTEGDLASAERYADRARREPGRTLQAPILQAKLLIQLRQHDRALEVLEPLVPLDPEARFLRLRTLLAAGAVEGAVSGLSEILAAFSANAVPDIGSLARAVCAACPRFRGWVGLSSSGEIAGAVLAAPGAELVLRTAHGTTLTAPQPQASLAPTTASALVPFRMARPPLPDGQTFSLESTAGPLLGGSRLCWPPRFGFSGEVRGIGSWIRGSVRLEWDPEAAIRLQVEDASGKRRSVSLARSAGRSLGQHASFSLLPEWLGLAGNLYTVTARLPDGRTEPLVGSPVSLSGPLARPTIFSASAVRPRTQRGKPAGISLVWIGRVSSDRLKMTLGASLPAGVRLIAAEMSASDLENLAREHGVAFVGRHAEESIASFVNRAVAHRPRDDVVLLDSDVELFGPWLERLQDAAYSRPDVGLAHPLSNGDDVRPYPGNAARRCDRPTAREIDSLAAKVGKAIASPGTSGPAIYFRRDCIGATGDFDAYFLGSGAGLAMDFGLRARRLGWRGVLAANVFALADVEEPEPAMGSVRKARAREVLRARHPGYEERIEQFRKDPETRVVLRALDAARLPAEASVLLVTLALKGGVGRHVADRAQHWRRSGIRPIELRPLRPTGSACQCRLMVDGAGFEHLVFTLPAELDELSALLSRCGVQSVEIHHSLGLSPTALDLPTRLGVAYDVYIHDYSWVCPRVTMLPKEMKFCGEPELSVCEACVLRSGSSLEEQIGVGDLRQRSAVLLSRARRVVAPSEDAARRLRRYFPWLDVSVVPWETLAASPRAAAVARVPRLRARAVLIGAIGEHKGFGVLRACADDAERRDLPLEFVVIGHSENDDALFATNRVFVTGEYAEQQIDWLLAREQADVAFFPSIWPETWCYSLTPALRAGLPILASDIGAFPERLHGYPDARLFSPGLAPPAVNALLMELARRTPAAHNEADYGWSRPRRASA